LNKRNVGVNSRNWEKEKDIKQRLSDRVISYFIGKYFKIRYRLWMLRKEANESKLNLQDLSRICSEHVLPVTSPLALIAEIQGSGGALLSQLFDGHSELHVHPHQLMIGHMEKGIWPEIDLSHGPERWFEVLFDNMVNEYNREGYKKEKDDKETFPFVFISSLQREIFLNYIDSLKSKRMRDVFDAFMTSYFGAWLNNQNYYGRKKFIVAYMPAMGIVKENMASFFEVYPEGRLISVIRDPKSWFPSAKERWPGSYTDVGQASTEWNKSAQAVLWNRERYGDRVCLIQYEDLISRTEAVMRFLSEFLSIEFDDILLTPTFNKFEIKANNSLKIEDRVAVNSRLSGDDTLPQHEVGIIEKVTREKYSLVLKEAVRFG
jgi:hypothetical protein